MLCSVLLDGILNYELTQMRVQSTNSCIW